MNSSYQSLYHELINLDITSHDDNIEETSDDLSQLIRYLVKIGNTLIEKLSLSDASNPVITKTDPTTTALLSLWSCIQSELELLQSFSPNLKPKYKEHISSFLDGPQQLRGIICQSIGFHALQEKSTKLLLNDLKKWHYNFIPSLYILTLVRSTSTANTFFTPRLLETPAVASIQTLRTMLHNPDYTPPSPFPPYTQPFQPQNLYRKTYHHIIERFVLPQVRDPILSSNLKSYLNLAHCLSILQPSDSNILSAIKFQEDRTVVRYKNHPCDEVNIHIGFLIPYRVALQIPMRLRKMLLPGGDLNYRSCKRYQDSLDIPSKEKRRERVLSLAGDLARSVLAAHTAGLCHMDVRPEAVLVVKEPERKRAYLVDFELPKREMVQFGTGFWGKARSDTGYVYHPLGHKPKTMAGDIYSIGVTLLEMGLGMAFVVNEEGVLAEMLHHNRKWRVHYQRILLEKWASGRKLNKRMGQEYVQVVLNCLTALEWEEGCKNDVEMGVMFAEKVIKELAEIGTGRLRSSPDSAARGGSDGLITPQGSKEDHQLLASKSVSRFISPPTRVDQTLPSSSESDSSESNAPTLSIKRRLCSDAPSPELQAQPELQSEEHSNSSGYSSIFGDPGSDWVPNKRRRR